MHVIRLLLLLTTAKAAKVAPLPTGAKRFLVVGQPRAGSTEHFYTGSNFSKTPRT